MNMWYKIAILALTLAFLKSTTKGQNHENIDVEYITNLLSMKNDSSIIYIDSLIRLEKANPKLFFLKGLYYKNKESLELAKNFYYQTINIDSTFFEAFYNLGVIYYNQGVETHNICKSPESYEEHLETYAAGQNYYFIAKVYFEKAKALRPRDSNLKDVLQELNNKLEP